MLFVLIAFQTKKNRTMKAKTILCSAIIGCCIANSAIAQHMSTGPARPHLQVYKTRADYRNLVPVILSDDKSKIVSYPAPQDIKAGGTQLLPAALHKGYLLDNRGIGTNTAFINMTWEKYAALSAAPSADELFSMIKDKNPIITLCDCGKKSAFKHPAVEMNRLIDSKQLLKHCTVIKNSKN